MRSAVHLLSSQTVASYIASQLVVRFKFVYFSFYSAMKGGREMIFEVVIVALQLTSSYRRN